VKCLSMRTTVRYGKLAGPILFCYFTE
jgi:hypothetical protein